MARTRSATEVATVIAVGGTLLAVAIPAFARNLHFSRLSEPTDGLSKLAKGALSYAQNHPQNISFPPSAPLTPTEVPRAVAVTDPAEAWQHLTWLSLHFGFDSPHRFAFAFDSGVGPATGAMRFVATAHGDLDGDGALSTFEVRGERQPGLPARVVPGMYVELELE